MPRVESLRQNTPEWRAWRALGLGSSDAPVVMGDSQWRKPRELWELKTGRRAEEDDNPAMQRGRALEEAARVAYESHTGEQMEPHCFVHHQHSWMRASLDGISFDGSTILEIKCPLSQFDRIAAREGRVPRHYYAQLQHQLEVCCAERAHYWSFDGSAERAGARACSHTWQSCFPNRADNLRDAGRCGLRPENPRVLR